MNRCFSTNKWSKLGKENETTSYVVYKLALNICFHFIKYVPLNRKIYFFKVFLLTVFDFDQWIFDCLVMFVNVITILYSRRTYRKFLTNIDKYLVWHGYSKNISFSFMCQMCLWLLHLWMITANDLYTLIQYTFVAISFQSQNPFKQICVVQIYGPFC